MRKMRTIVRNKQGICPVKIVATRNMPSTAMQPLIDRGWTVDMPEAGARYLRPELLRRSVDADALLAQGTDRIDRALIERAAQLKIISCCSIGYDNIDVQAAHEKGVVVCNAPATELVEATVEAAVALLLSVAKRITRLHIANRQNALPPYSFDQPMGISVRNRTSGIVGAGRIGGGIARIMHHGFDNAILYYARSAKPRLEAGFAAERCDLQNIFKRSDFVFIVVPLTATTKRLIGRSELRYLQHNSIIINVSRAGIVDDAVLTELLSQNHFFGAGLDVYEPVAADCDHANLLLTGHMANGDAEAMQAVAALAVDNVMTLLTGTKPLTSVGA